MTDYTDATTLLHKTITITIDRPLGSSHPLFTFIYPVNYGFVPHTKGPDNEELDAYVLGIFEPLSQFTGTCIAVIHRFNNEDKLVLAPPGKTYTDDQIIALTEFQERFFTSTILRKSPDQKG